MYGPRGLACECKKCPLPQNHLNDYSVPVLTLKTRWFKSSFVIYSSSDIFQLTVSWFALVFYQEIILVGCIDFELGSHVGAFLAK